MPLKLAPEAKLKFDEAKKNPDYQGVLEKRGEKRKTWNRRWVIMKDRYIFYCKDLKSDLPQGIINVMGSSVQKEELKAPRQFGFSIQTAKSVSIEGRWTNRKYYFSALCAADLEKWLSAIEVAVAKILKEEEANSKARKPGSKKDLKNEDEIQALVKKNKEKMDGTYRKQTESSSEQVTPRESTTSDNDNTTPSPDKSVSWMAAKTVPVDTEADAESSEDEKTPSDPVKLNDVDVSGSFLNLPGTVASRPRSLESAIPDDRDTQLAKLTAEIDQLKLERDTLLQDKQNIEARRRCLACKHNDFDMLLSPCNHLCVCEACVPSVKQCPICSTEITSSQKVAFPQ